MLRASWPRSTGRRALSSTRRLRGCHASAVTSSSPERIQVPTSSNGTITVEYVHLSPLSITPSLIDESLHYPKELSSSTPSPSVAIYLPRGPILQDDANDASNIAILNNTLSCPAVQINYRCDAEHRFPTAIHDVLAGYDWVVHNLLPKRAIVRPGRSERVGRLAVCGELLGGSLATAIALTECRIGEPAITAAAINNPITDWTALDYDDDMPLTRQQMDASSTNLSREVLLQYRKLLFRKPDHYFDPFASPILFFRSAGSKVPAAVEHQTLSEMEELMHFERDESLREQFAHGAQVDINHSEETVNTKKRKTSRKFPSKTLGLRLPYFRIDSGADAVLSIQATELAHQLRRSVERQQKPLSKHAHRVADDNETQTEVSKDAVQLCWSAGEGLWDDSRGGKARMRKAAEWIDRTLDM